MLQAPVFGEVGVDEAGRGCLWGDVVAAAVILPVVHEPWMSKLNDSKKLSAKARAALASEIKAHAVAWGVGRASAEEIDNINILQAAMLAMHRAIDALGDIEKLRIMVDGTHFKRYHTIPHQCVIGGDAKVMSIAAASILAKETRDADVLEACESEPDLKLKYGMDKHKGYGTLVHREALKEHGIHVQHRKTYAPVADLLNP
jgi:ribonuclease HII